MAPFDNGFSSNLITKLSPLIEGQVPDFVQGDHGVFVRFLKHYYQYLESGELRVTASIDNMLLEVETESFLLLEDGAKIVLETSLGKFIPNEIITGSTSKATATVLVDDLGNSTKSRMFISGQQQFKTGETITGGTSGATAVVDRYRGNPIQNLQQLLEYANTDNTIYDFLDQLRDSFMNAIPKELATGLDQRNLIKNIRELYRAKGTSEGHKIFLRMLLDQNAAIIYPNEFMMRASDGNWGYKNILRCSPGANSDPLEMVGQAVTGKTSGATAVVADATSTAEGLEEISEFEINPASLTGTFVDGEIITGVAVNQDVTMSFTVRGIVTSYAVTDGGKLYSVDDVLDLDTQSAIGNGEATAKVGSIKLGSVSRVVIDDVGSNYRVGDALTFTATETGTSTKAATGFVSVIDGSISIDGTDSSGTDADDNLILEDGSTSSFVSIGSIICEDATGTGTQFLILDRSNTSGANVGAHISLGDQLTIDSHGTENDTFALESGTIKSIDASANIGEIARVFIKDGGDGYSLLPSVSVTSSLGSSTVLLADTDDIGAVDSVDITNQGFKYTVAPEGRFRANFLLKDVTGTFAAGNTLTTAGFTGTVISFDSTTKLLKTTFEDVERITMETGDSNQIVLEDSLFVLGDRAGETDFKIDNHLAGEGDLQLETGDSILIDATAEVAIDRIVTEDNLSNVFLIREDGTIHNGVVRLQLEDATGGGSLRYEDATGQDRVLTEITTSNQSSRVDGPGDGFLLEQSPTTPVTVDENDSIRTDNTLDLGKFGDMRLLFEDGDRIIGEETGNSIILNGSDAATPQANVRGRLLGNEEALSGNLELDGTNSSSADAGDDIIFEDAPDFSSETITITDSDGATGTIVSVDIAKGTSSIGTKAITTASYSNIESLLGEALNRIQDSVYYQQFSYEVQVGTGAADYVDELKKAVHPAGFNVIPKVSIATLVSAEIPVAGSSLGGGFTSDTDKFSPILASTFEIIFQEQVSKESLAITRPVAGYDDKIVMEIDNPDGVLILESATSGGFSRLISEDQAVKPLSQDRILLETSDENISNFLLFDSVDVSLVPGTSVPLLSALTSGAPVFLESAQPLTFNLELEPPNTVNGGDLLPGATITSDGILDEDGDNLELELYTPTTGTQRLFGHEKTFFTFDVSVDAKVLDEDGANLYLETAGVGYRNTAGERGLVISRVTAKINLPNKNVNSIPNGAVFLGENAFDEELGGISLELGRTGLGTGALTLNGFNQVNPLGNVDRVAATGDKIQLQTSTDSNAGSGVTFKDFGEYINDFIVLNGSDVSSSNAGDNILLEAGTLTDTRHRLKDMLATDVLMGETRLVQSFHKIRDIIRPPRLVARKDSGEIVNIISEHIGSSGNETTSSPAGSIKLEDDLLVNGDGNLLLEVDGPLGNKYALESNSSFLVPEDFTSNQNTGVVPPENFGVSSVLNIEPRHYSSDVTKRPLGGISFESTGVGEVHIRLEDGTVGVIAGSHRPAGDGFLISDGELVTTGDTVTLTNVGVRMGMEFSLHPGRAEQGLGHGVVALNRAPKGDNNNIGERLILESATIFDYLENTGAVTTAVSNEFGFDNTSLRFDQTGFTFDSTL